MSRRSSGDPNASQVVRESDNGHAPPEETPDNAFEMIYMVKLPDGTKFAVGYGGLENRNDGNRPQVGDGPPSRWDGPIPWYGYQASLDCVDSILVQPRMVFRDADGAVVGRATSHPTFVVRLARTLGNPRIMSSRWSFADQPYWFPSLRLGRTWPANGYYKLFAASYYENYVAELEAAALEDPATADLVQRRRYGDHHDTANWKMMAVMSAMLHPHPDDHGTVRDPLDYGRLPGPSSARRAVRVVLGPHGVAQAWTRGPVPNVAYVMLTAGRDVPWHWCPDPGSDGDSSYNSDSPGEGGGDGAAEWMATAAATAAATGRDSSYCSNSDCNKSSTSISSSSSSTTNSDSDDWPGRDLQLSRRECRKLMAFDTFVRSFHRDRRTRRAIRRARREVRAHLDPERLQHEPGYDQTARQAEMIASGCAWQVCEDQRLGDRNRSKYAHKRWGHGRHLTTTNRKLQAIEQLAAELAQNRFNEFRLQLGGQVFSAWQRHYGHLVDSPLHLRCWISPVRWVQQTGPK